MDNAALATLLETSSLQVAYHHWKTPPDLPYIVYKFIEDDNFSADNKAYFKANAYQVELYSDLKDPASEALVETVFDTNDIFYEKDEGYIESEKFYMVAYQIEV